MSIQLDGYVTYPRDQANGRSQGSGKTGTGALAVSSSIIWEGWWHYSHKQTRGSNAPSSFKYFFVGPEVARSQRAAEGGPPTTPSASTSSEPMPNQPVPRGQIVSLSDSTSNSTTNQLSTEGASGVNFAGGSLATRSEAHVATSVLQSSVASGHGRPQLAINVPWAPSSTGREVSIRDSGIGSDGSNVAPSSDKLPVQMLLYGPGGDGRLPSGTWAGQFAVKTRGNDFMVSESFVLEFGSGKSPKMKSSTPAVTADTFSANASDAASPLPTSASLSERSQGISGAVTGAETFRPTRDSKKGVAECGIDKSIEETSFNVPGSGIVGSLEPNATVASMGEKKSAGGITTEPASVPPVVRVSGWGQNRYGEFTLTGGHERATGRLDLTRFYYEKPRPSAGSASHASRGEGTSVSSHKKRRSLPAGAPPPPPPGPSLAERRTKRTRCPNQRFDDDAISHNHASDASGNGSVASRRRSVGDVCLSSTTSPSDPGGAGWTFNGSGSEAITVSETSRRGTSGAKSRRPRDRERDLLMEQNRRAKKKTIPQEIGRISADAGGVAGAAGSSMGTAEIAAAELAERARAGREALSGADLASLMGSDSEQDRILKEALENMEKEQAGLEAEAAAAVAAAEAEAEAEAEAQAVAAARAAEAMRVETNGGSGSRGGRKSRGVQDERWRSLSLDEETGEIYEGGMYRGRRHGRGMCVYQNQNMYEGDWRLGKEHGMGRIMRPNRTLIYDGEFADGKLCGKGQYVDESGDVYDGDWKDSLRHGHGVYTFSSDSSTNRGVDGKNVEISTYSGDFKDNVRCGRGVQTWPGGSYDGEWLNDTKHGRGVLRTSDGFVYDGNWVDDLPEGRGMCIHPNGQRYEGIFKGGKKEGRGTLAFANGASYEGRFRDDAIDGQGMLHIPRPVEDEMGGWMIPIQFQSDIERIHVKAGFDKGGL